MKTIHKSVLLSHSAHEMFALVTNIEHYPQFLPWCDHGEVLELKEAMVKSREQGCVTFDTALFELAEKGLITRDEAMRNADSVNDLRVKFRLESKSAGSAAEFKGAAGLSLDSDLTKKLGLEKK